MSASDDMPNDGALSVDPEDARARRRRLTGLPPSAAPGSPAVQLPPPVPAPVGRLPVRERLRAAPRLNPRRNAIWFALTLLTTGYWGFLQYQFFYLAESGDVILNPFADLRLLAAGLPYGLAVIAFLAAHEMGHYLACRYYGIRATLPYFIPIPPIPGIVIVPGTMGAVIRILGPLKSRRALFDIAIAGPIAGFIVALPIIAVGLTQSRTANLADLGGATLQMGEPLIWQPLQAIFAPPIGPEQTLIAHPLAFVGWFALLVTAMNLLPIGQLDGGHLLYTITPRFHRPISLAAVAAMIYAGWVYFPGWFIFAAMVLFLGTRHPRPLVFEHSLGPARRLLLLIAALIFITSFMVVPLSVDLTGF